MDICLAGAGMGMPATMTAEVHDALSRADCIIGAERLLAELRARYQAEYFAEAIPEKIASIIFAHPEWRSVCVALSGDTGFYSGAKQLAALLADHSPRILPGISAPSAFAAALDRPWQGWYLVSAHGLSPDIVAGVMNHSTTFFLTGGANSAEYIIDQLCAAGLDSASVTVGENLGTANQRIISGTARQLSGQTFQSLSVVLVENAPTFALPPGPAGLPDDMFIRGDVPMTKQEVRAIALALLQVKPNSLVYDIGAGTGSVAVEAALQARSGTVYAVESRQQAIDLIQANKRKFGVHNLRPVHGTAPEALAGFPPPDACFIGGSGGKMDGIIAAVVSKNPEATIVIAAIALESLHQATAALERAGRRNIDVRQIGVARTTERGGLRMLSALNPVFLIASGVDCG